MPKTVVTIPLLLITLFVAACGGQSVGPVTIIDDPSPLATPIEVGPEETLRVALLPILDVLPFHVAVENDYFGQVGVKVESIPVKSGQERDTLMQTGQVDGMLTDLISPILFNQDAVQIKIVRTARISYPDAPMFRLIAKPDSSIENPQALAGIPIGIAQNTVTEYLSDRMLESRGLSPNDIAIQEVSAIPVRFELLMSGEVEAAVLPDPLASGAIMAGAKPIIDDTSVPGLAQSILTFSTDSLERRPEAIRRFLQAWEMAIEELNANPEQYRSLLVDKVQVPQSVQDSYPMPPFPEAQITSPDQFNDVLRWAQDKGIVDQDVLYQDSVDNSFLP